MSQTIQPQKGILDISPYVGGEAAVSGVEDVIKLSSNENLAGPGDKAIEAYKKAAGELHLYPSSDHRSLRQAISDIHGLDREKIICGAGSDEIIAFLCQAYAGPGDEVLYSQHGFAMYRISALANGATPVVAPETDRHTDVDALLAAVSERTKLLFIANPNNPTGTMISASEIERLADQLPPHVLLVLDGAYAEYVDGFNGHADLVENRDNVFMTRTFSKIYGLGSLRIGYGYGPAHVIDVLNRIRGPFNVNRAALAAAEVAVRDTGWTSYCREENARWRDWLAAELEKIQVHSDPSFGNFILARFRSEDEADRADQFLKNQGLIVRKVGGYGLPEALRITIGGEVACRRLAAALKTFRGGA